MSKVATIGADRAAPQDEAPRIVSANDIILSADTMDRMMAFAKIMATGRVTLPAELRNEGDCLAITMQAAMWGMNPFAVAQKTHVVSGKLGYEAQLVNAVINQSRVTKDRMNFEWFGPWERVIGKFAVRKGDKGEYRTPNWSAQDEEGCGVRAWATLRGESEPRELELLLTQARTRNSTLWADDPRQQLAYLAQKRWCRLYAPDVLLGVYTADELEAPSIKDMGSADVVDAPTKQASRTSALKDRLGVKQPAGPSVMLGEALAAIEQAADRDGIHAARAICEQLTDADEIATAQDAYGKRLEVLRAEAASQASTVTDGDDDGDDFLDDYENEEGDS